MKKKSILLMVLSLFMIVGTTNIDANAMSTYHQHRYALQNPNFRKYRLVYNANHTSNGYHYRYVGDYLKNPFETKPNYIKGKGAAHKLKFETDLFLPGGSGHVHHYNNPQGVAITPDGHYAFVSYNNTPEGQRGWIARYDLKRLNQLGVSTNQMDLLRRVFSLHHHHHPMTPLERQVKAATFVGPKFRMGHGQSLSYNPKTKQLWILGIGPGAQNYANAQRISIKTLKPVHKINFTFSKIGLAINDVLTFDKHGNAYNYVCSYGGKGHLKKGIVKLYKGHISDHKVSFKLVMQGIRHAPGYISQSLAYNPSNDRIYLVSDGSILSMQTSRLGHLKPHQVQWTGFKTHREFEGLGFDQSGRSYLLVNRGVELLTTTQKW